MMISCELTTDSHSVAKLINTNIGSISPFN